MKDLYDLLGISPLATPEEIKIAYRKMAMKYHPDRDNTPEAASKFLAAKSAYETLSDPASREQYNVTRSNAIIPDPLATAKGVWEKFIHTTIGAVQ